MDASEIVDFLDSCTGSHMVYLFEINHQNICKLIRVIGCCNYSTHTECNLIASEYHVHRNKLLLFGVPDGEGYDYNWDEETMILNDNFHCLKIVIG